MFVSKLFKHWTYQIFFPGAVLREKYDAFKQLLEHDKRSHELIAELEDIHYNRKKVDLKVVEGKYARLSAAVSGMVENLMKMAPSRYVTLGEYLRKIDFYVRFIFAPPDIQFAPPFTVALDEGGLGSPDLVGGKALNLMRLRQTLKLPEPNGFVITSNAFHYFLEFNNLRPFIDKRLARLDAASPRSLDTISREIVEAVRAAQVPYDVEKTIMSSMAALRQQAGKEVRVAIRSSAVNEDTVISFAGQYLTVLNVDESKILEAYKRVLASKYTPRALFYRINYGLSDFETPMAVVVLEMIDAAASGAITTSAPEEAGSDIMNIHSLWGLGELLMGGEVSPDSIAIRKKENKPVIVRRQAGDKFQELVTAPTGESRLLEVEKDRRKALSLTDEQALKLAGWAMRIEKFYGQPQEIEWCMDREQRLFILQSRPLQVENVPVRAAAAEKKDISNPALLRGGERASSGAGAGRVFVVDHENRLEDIPQGAVLVAQTTLPAYVKVLDRLEAVVTDRGGVAGHFVSVAREFGVPVLVGTGNATEKLRHGQKVTVDANGTAVYDEVVPALVKGPRTRRDLVADSPFARKLKYIIGFVSPLKLVDPKDPAFVPEGCRSLHDIIRFTHEKGMEEMFAIGDRGGGKIKGARRLVSDLPLDVYVLDVGRGLQEPAAEKQEIAEEDMRCVPLKAVWKGLTHPAMEWSQRTHFDWKTFDAISLAGGVARKSSEALASYAVISGEYLNLNMRFGYHFTIVDTMCGKRPQDNYVMLRFAGGGGDFQGRALRVEFLAAILNRLGFSVDTKGDLVDARILQGRQNEMEDKLDMVGRLLGATRLMDMVLKDSAMVREFVNDFFKGRYNFSAEKTERRQK